MTNEQLWQSVMGEVELSISKASFTTWFKDTGILSIDQEEIVVGVPSGFAKEWLKNKYHKFILTAFQKIHPEIKTVTYKIVGNFKSSKNNTPADSNIKQEEISSNDFTNSYINAIVSSNPRLRTKKCPSLTPPITSRFCSPLVR